MIRTLRGPVPPDFEAFYRLNLRYRTGSRVRSSELAARYHAWAEQAEAAPHMSFPAMREAMEQIGHRRRTSNGTYYANAAWVEDAPDLPDNFPALTSISPVPETDLVHRIDNVMAELQVIRSRVCSHG